MAALPCKNPQCKSRGTPHPNCRCYPNMMAEGGEVNAVCSGQHMEECQHYLASPATDDDDFTAACAHLGAQGLFEHPDIDKHIRAIRRGTSSIKSLISGVLDGKDSPSPDDLEARRDKVHKYLEDGGITQDIKEALYQQQEPQKFAAGGQVTPGKNRSSLLHDKNIAMHYPVQNVMLNATKGRVSNYLNTLRPNATSLKLPFDDDEDNTEKTRKYHRAIDVANHPLGVLGDIGKGTIEPEQVGHLNNLYPELSERLKRNMTEKITEAQLEGKKPSYKVRQGLSLFMGAPLSSELTPQLIQAAQLTFVGKQQQPDQHQPPPKGKKAALSKSDEAFLTGDQALTKRAQAQR